MVLVKGGMLAKIPLPWDFESTWKHLVLTSHLKGSTNNQHSFSMHWSSSLGCAFRSCSGAGTHSLQAQMCHIISLPCPSHFVRSQHDHPLALSIAECGKTNQQQRDNEAMPHSQPMSIQFQQTGINPGISSPTSCLTLDQSTSFHLPYASKNCKWPIQNTFLKKLLGILGTYAFFNFQTVLEENHVWSNTIFTII